MLGDRLAVGHHNVRKKLLIERGDATFHRLQLRLGLDQAEGNGLVLDGQIRIDSAMPVRGVATSGWRGRSQSLGFRAAVAMPGHFGVELDPRQLSTDDRAELADWIAFHKQWRHVLHHGQTWLGSGADGLVWQAVGRAEQFLLFVIRCAPALDRRPQPLPLPFLSAHQAVDLQLLRIAGGQRGHAMASAPLFEAMQAAPQRFTGSWLARAGLPLPPLKAESVAIYQGSAA
mgnify:CR=1 FL=1